MKFRYILRPGFVISESDGERHYITYGNLVELYGVHLLDCVPYMSHRHPSDTDYVKHIELWPKPNGDYNLQELIDEKTKSDQRFRS